MFAAEKTISTNKTTHITYLVIILLFLFLPFLISYSPEQTTPPTIHSIKLSPSCLSEVLFGTKCPGCGLTRSFVLLTHGHFKAAAEKHRLGPLLYIFFISLALFKIYCIRNPGKKLTPVIAELQFILPFLMLCLLFLNWFFGIFLGGN